MSTIMQKISDHCGIVAALKISGVYGGRTMYVPEKWSRNHRLARLIGEDELAGLISVYGGETIDIARLPELQQYRQVGTVLRMRDRPLSEIAAATGLSEKYAQSLLQRYAYLTAKPRRGDLDRDDVQTVVMIQLEMEMDERATQRKPKRTAARKVAGKKAKPKARGNKQ